MHKIDHSRTGTFWWVTQIITVAMQFPLESVTQLVSKKTINKWTSYGIDTYLLIRNCLINVNRFKSLSSSAQKPTHQPTVQRNAHRYKIWIFKKIHVKRKLSSQDKSNFKKIFFTYMLLQDPWQLEVYLEPIWHASII